MEIECRTVRRNIPFPPEGSESSVASSVPMMQMTKRGRRIDPIVRIDRVFFRKTFFKTSGRKRMTPSLPGRNGRRRRDADRLAGSAHILLQHPLVEVNQAVRAGGGLRIVCDDQDRLLELVVEALEEDQDLLAAPGVEITRRLVGDEKRRVGRDRTGDRDALLLPA